MICSNQTFLEKKLEHLKNAFHKKNGYPLWMINQVIEIVRETVNTETKLSSEEPRNWKLSIKFNLLLMEKLIYFSNLFKYDVYFKIEFA